MLKTLIRIAVVTVLAFLPAHIVSAANINNPNYVNYPDTDLIQRDLGNLDRVYRRNYHKFISYKASNERPIYLVANKSVSDEQLLRAYNILDFYLTDVSGAKFGSMKSAIANHMAQAGAVLVMPDGADGDSITRDSALAGQPLYELEFPIEGSSAYINNDYENRDAGFEEIFHMIHDYGIGTKYADGVLKDTYQVKITKAMENALIKKIWGNGSNDVKSWLDELEQEGSLEQEYIASVIDSYYGLWGAFTETQGGMWGIYMAKHREEITQLDPMGFALMEMFFSPNITYMARIDPSFEGTFQMTYDPAIPYTHKSRYLTNARLLGNKRSNLKGNNQDNTLIGNMANNLIDGKDGYDVAQYDDVSGKFTIKKTENGVTIANSASLLDVDTLINIEVLRFHDKDILVSNIR